MSVAPPTSWRPFAVPCGRRLSVRFDSGVRGEDNFHVPSMRVEVEDDAYVVIVRIPGAEREELDLTLRGDLLRVTGERRRRTQRNNGHTPADARYLSRFTREIALARPIETESVEACFAAGLLTVRLPVLVTQPPEEDALTRIEIH